MKSKKKHLTLLVSLAAGGLLGVLAHPYLNQIWLQWTLSNLIGPIGQIFLRLLFMAVVPLIFSALVLGVLELGQHHGLRVVMRQTLFYTVIASSFSVMIGIGLVNVFKPGVRLHDQAIQAGQAADAVAALQQNVIAAKPFGQVVIELFTKNPLETAAKVLSGEILPWMVFALIFGLALSAHLQGRSSDSKLVGVLEEVYAVCMKIIGYAMRLAPLGVFALVFQTAAKSGLGVIQSLLFYVSIVVGGLLIQQFVVYAALLKWGAKRSPWAFFMQAREVFLYAFSTASSNATLPKSMEAAEHVLKIPPRIARFVLTVGSTLNQNGTALFEGVTVLFLAQVYGIELGFAQQFQVVLMSIIAGIGTAGVPGGSLPPIMILLQSLGIPAEGIGLILGVDRFLDMCRTTINVSGDLVIAAVVGRRTEKLLR